MRGIGAHLILGLLLTLSVCACVPPVPCTVVSTESLIRKDAFDLAASVSRDARVVYVHVKNNADAPIQLLLQEWSLTAMDQASSIVPVDTPNGIVASVVLAPITLPPGASYGRAVFMRSHHNFAATFLLSPMIPIHAPCSYSGEITLSYVIVVDERRIVGSITMPVSAKGPARQ